MSFILIYLQIFIMFLARALHNISWKDVFKFIDNIAEKDIRNANH